MKIVSTFFIYALLLFRVYAQSDAIQAKYEVSIKNEEEHTTYVLTDRKEAIFSYRQKEYKNSLRVKAFVLLDENLNKIKEKKISYDIAYEEYFEKRVGDVLYVVLSYENTGIVKVITFNLITFEESVIDFKFKSNTIVDDFFMLKGKAILTSLTKKKDKVYVTTYDLMTKQTEVIDFTKLTKLYLEYKGVNETDFELQKEVVVKFMAPFKEGKKCVYFTFNHTGDLKRQPSVIDFPPSENKIHSYIISKMTAEDYAIMGMYGLKRWPNGVFMGRIQNGTVSYVNYINFTSINNFADYLQGTQAAAYYKQEAKNSKTGEETNVNMFATFHDLKRGNDQYVMAVEFYYPYYVSRVNGDGTSSTYFLGYQYTHGSIVGFDEKCNFLWSNSILTNMYYMPKTPQTHLNIILNKNEVIVSFANKYEYKSYTLVEGVFLKEKEIVKNVFGKEKDDVVKSFTFVSGNWWYENNLILIQNKIQREEKKAPKEKIIGVYKVNY
ncbi:MAG: hypothetical protein MUE33_08930 [Cytophagaceae bacterium]|jgi:hypothetical protein|nr:hypothetical protein [Cytophagaceae bacterium]